MSVIVLTVHGNLNSTGRIGNHGEQILSAVTPLHVNNLCRNEIIDVGAICSLYLTTASDSYFGSY